VPVQWLLPFSGMVLPHSGALLPLVLPFSGMVLPHSGALLPVMLSFSGMVLLSVLPLLLPFPGMPSFKRDHLSEYRFLQTEPQGKR
jgi:hypothetical protein